MGRVVPPGRLGELAKIRAEGKRDIFDPLPLMKEQAMKRAYAPDPDRDPFVIHPSEMCKVDWCIRATFYRISGKKQPEREFNWVLENIFEKGNYTHTWYQSLLTDTGELFGSWRCAICGRWEHNVLSRDLDRVKPCAHFMGDDKLSHGVPHVWEYKEVRLRDGSIAGKSDGGIRDTLMEFKTVGLGTIRADAENLLKKYYIEEYKVYNLDLLWRDLSRPFLSHVKQGNVYLYLAHQMGLTQFKRMTYVYEFKANQQTKKFQVAYSDDIMQPLLEKVRKIEDALQWNRPPACEFGGCEQCRAYEGDSSEAGKPAADANGRQTRRVVTRRPAGAGEAEARESAPATGRRATRAPRGADRAARPRADVADDAAKPVERVPGLSAQRSTGRRAVRREASREADRPGADPQ